jgi:hypothetical protein
LLFADAHVRDRCAAFSVGPTAYVDVVTAANASGDPTRLDAACGQCTLMLAPHLRFGIDGDHDPRREALCAFVPGTPGFVYTEEDPTGFTDSEPTDVASLRAATRERCGCSVTTTTTTTSTTSTLPGGATLLRQRSEASALIDCDGGLDADADVQDTNDGVSPGPFGGIVTADFSSDFQRSGHAEATHVADVQVAGTRLSGASASGLGMGMVTAEFPSALDCLTANGNSQARFEFSVSGSVTYSLSASATESTGPAFALVLLAGPGGEVYWLDSLGNTEGSASGVLPAGAYVMRGQAGAEARVALLEGNAGTESATFDFALTLGGP